jgi:hypothetical protein
MQAPALTYHDWIANHALRRTNAPAAIDLASGRRFTYGQFHARIDGIAACLADDLGSAQASAWPCWRWARPTCSKSSSPAPASARSSFR